MDFACINDFYTADSILADNMTIANTVSRYNAKDDVQFDDLYFLTGKFQKMKALLAELKLYNRNKTSKLFSIDLHQIKKFYDDMSKMSVGEKGHPGGPCKPGITRPFVDINGVIYPCEKVSEDSDIMKIGHIDTGFDLEKINAMLNVGKITEDECKVCWNFIHCGLCVATCDGNSGFSKEERLKYCLSSMYNTFDTLKTICWFLENGFDFSSMLFTEKGRDHHE